MHTKSLSLLSICEQGYKTVMKGRQELTAARYVNWLIFRRNTTRTNISWNLPIAERVRERKKVRGRKGGREGEIRGRIAKGTMKGQIKIHMETMGKMEEREQKER